MLRTRWMEVAGFGVLGLALFGWWCQLEGPLFRDAYLNADLIVLPTVVEDVLVRGHPYFRAWHLTPAPYFFPDGALALLGRLLFHSVEALQRFAVAAQVLLLALAARGALAALRPDQMGLPAVGVALVGLCVTLGLSGRAPFFFLLFPAYHSGVAVVTLAALALWLSAPRLGGRVRLAAFCLLLALGAASDTLVPLACLPGLGFASWWGLRSAAEPARAQGRAALFGLVAVAAGAALGRVVVPFADRGQHALRLGVLGQTLAQAGVDWAHFDPLTTGLLTLGLVALLAGALWLPAKLERAVAAALAAGTVLTLAAILATGNLSDGKWLRYLLCPMVSGLLGCVLVLARGPRRVRVLLLGLGLATFALSAPSGWKMPSAPGTAALQRDVACLDALAVEEDARVVLTDYWHAKPLTLLSAVGVRAAQFEDALTEPKLWVTSRAWYGPSSQAGLVVMNGLQPDAADRALGPADELRACGSLSVRIYREAARERLRRFLDEGVRRSIGEVPR